MNQKINIEENYDVIDFLKASKFIEANKLLTNMVLETKENDKNILKFQYKVEHHNPMSSRIFPGNKMINNLEKR